MRLIIKLRLETISREKHPKGFYEIQLDSEPWKTHPDLQSLISLGFLMRTLASPLSAVSKPSIQGSTTSSKRKRQYYIEIL